MMVSMPSRRRLTYALIVVLVVLAILSFVLPNIGGGDSGLTKLFP
jgi:preprotein translocase subunit SecE